MSSPNSKVLASTRSLSLWGELLGSLRLVFELMRDARVATALKVGIPLFVAAYIVLPINFIPIFGELDDLAIILLAIRLFIALAPKDVVNEYRSGATGATPQSTATQQRAEEAVEAAYRVVG